MVEPDYPEISLWCSDWPPQGCVGRYDWQFGGSFRATSHLKWLLLALSLSALSLWAVTSYLAQPFILSLCLCVYQPLSLLLFGNLYLTLNLQPFLSLPLYINLINSTFLSPAHLCLNLPLSLSLSVSPFLPQRLSISDTGMAVGPLAMRTQWRPVQAHDWVHGYHE